MDYLSIDFTSSIIRLLFGVATRDSAEYVSNKLLSDCKN